MNYETSIIEHIINFLNLNSDIYKIIQAISPIIIAFITIMLAQKRWKKDGYLKHKIELEIKLNKELFSIYSVLEQISLLINEKHIYIEEQLISIEKLLYELRQKLWDKKTVIFKLLNEYSLFKNDKLIENIKGTYISFCSKQPQGKRNFNLYGNTYTKGYLLDAEKTEIKIVLDNVNNLYKNIKRLKQSICKNFKKL